MGEGISAGCEVELGGYRISRGLSGGKLKQSKGRDLDVRNAHSGDIVRLLRGECSRQKDFLSPRTPRK